VRPAGTNTGDRADVVVLGGGPGGYTAAFRAADLGLRTVLVERHPRLGGVCLNVGCIPSKALLHAARILVEADEARRLGISFGQPHIDLDALRAAQERTIATLAGGLDGLAGQREVRVVRGTARLVSPFEVEVEADGANGSGATRISFASCIIAVGSEPARLPGLPDDPRIMDSTGALALPEIPERLLVVGGGIIGLEMAAVYDALGSRVTVVEMRDGLMPGCDPDLVRPLHRRIATRYAGVHVDARVASVAVADDGLHIIYEGAGAPGEQVVDRMLIAVGRRANGDRVGAEAAGVAVGERGVIAVDDRMQTNVDHIYAIGDVVGEPMLAHKAARQGAVAAEVIAGRASAFDVRSIPSVAYTDPEIAWTGLTETEARATGVAHEVHTVPWAASGRALTLGRSEGRTKLIVEPGSRRILGAGIVGVNAGELIAEVAHALEMGADAEDLALTIHPHPTLSETFRLAAEAADGSATDLYVQARQSRSRPE
jgi:dihydrolipoamide dehydrogenase